MSNPHRPVSPWLDGVLDEALAQLVSEKHSAGDIGKVLGVSRNAVIGRCHRTGLQLCSAPSGNPRPHRKHKPKPAAKKFGAALFGRSSAVGEGGPVVTPGFRGAEASPTPKKHKPPAYLGPRLRLLELRSRQCRYACDDFPPYWFCGAPTPSGSSWCAVHQAVVFA